MEAPLLKQRKHGFKITLRPDAAPFVFTHESPPSLVVVVLCNSRAISNAVCPRRFFAPGSPGNSSNNRRRPSTQPKRTAV